MNKTIPRPVMEQTEHCLLVGNGALEFAREAGFGELAPEELLTERWSRRFRKSYQSSVNHMDSYENIKKYLWSVEPFKVNY